MAPIGKFRSIFGSFYPETTRATIALLMWVSSAQAIALGYDSSMINGLNILPSYSEYFHINTTTLAVQSAMGWAGAMVASIPFGWVTDKLGRRNAIYVTSSVLIVGAILQAASQNVAMFVIARFLIGAGGGGAYVCGPTYLAETLPLKWRGLGLGIFMTFYYVGGLLAAGITYGSFQMDSTWAWRLPSALQCVFTAITMLAIPFVPESPRWLQSQNRQEEALAALALTHSDGNKEDPMVVLMFREITDTLAFEAVHGEGDSLIKAVKAKGNAKRLSLVLSVAAICMLSGNNVVSFYLGDMLNNAGITDADTQLQVNIYLNLWCLICALAGTWIIDFVGRKPVAIYTTVAITALLFMFGALTKSKSYGTSTNNSGIYGTVAVLFLFQGGYSFAWTPLAMVYPPEILNFSLRSSGMGAYTFFTNGLGLMVTMAFPYALAKIGWKTYMINGTWDALQVIFIVLYWVETKGKTLEEIDGLFDGVKYRDDVETDIIEGVYMPNNAADLMKTPAVASVDRKKTSEERS